MLQSASLTHTLGVYTSGDVKNLFIVEQLLMFISVQLVQLMTELA